MSNWTASNIPDLSGKIAIVTGGNSGLGFESVKAFAEHGAEVILACRTIEKGNDAKQQIGTTKGQIRVMELDLQDFSSIKSFAQKVTSSFDRLDILLNNAGIMTTPYFVTKDGLEGQMGTNHFGHFLLTSLLFELISKTPGARVINVSSNGHKYGKMDFDNLLFEEGKGYSPMKSYARSKLANLLFTYELQRRVEKANLDVKVLAAHPGGAMTNLASHLEKKFWFRMLLPLAERIMQDAASGALPQIRAAVDPEAKGGQYYGPSGFSQTSGSPVLVKSNNRSHDEGDASQLWEISEQLTSSSFTV